MTVASTIASYWRLCRLAERVASARGFDVCHLIDSETAYFWRPRRMPPGVITCHDLVAKRVARADRGTSGLGVRGSSGSLVARVQASAERRALRKFTQVFLLSHEEVDWCRRLHPGVSARLLRYPGGVGFVGLPRREVLGRVLFVGALGRPQNIESLRFLVHEVWPRVVERAPTAELEVVGTGAPPPLLAELASAPRVRATGEVESVEPAYCEAAVLAAPILTGGGVIVKILDALAVGVPVVTTQYGNEGVEGRPGRDLLVAPDAAAFADGIVRLLTSDAMRRDVGESGRRHVAAAFPPEGVIAAVEAAYRAALADGRPR